MNLAILIAIPVAVIAIIALIVRALSGPAKPTSDDEAAWWQAIR